MEAYYRQASPIHGLLAELKRQVAAGGGDQPTPLPPTLIVHAADDPWVPVAACERLARALPAADADESPAQHTALQVLITAEGGHNGFHSRCDHRSGLPGNWGDRLTARWMRQLVGVAPDGAGADAAEPDGVGG